MSDLIKKYPLDGIGIPGKDIFDAMQESPGAIYVDCPGLGMVEVSIHAAHRAMILLHAETGASTFALGKISKSHGLDESSRVLMHWM